MQILKQKIKVKGQRSGDQKDQVQSPNQDVLGYEAKTRARG